MTISRFYAIVDAEVLLRRGTCVAQFAEELRAGGVQLLQYRNKSGGPQEVLRNAAVIREVMAGSGCRLIMNDRADLAVLAGFDGVHVGQGDLSPEDARRVAKLLANLRVKVNLIPWNPGDLPYKPPDAERIEEFRRILTEKGLLAFVRYSRGQDVMAACGQLALLEASGKPPLAQISH